MTDEGPHVFLLVTEMTRAVDFNKMSLQYQNLFGEKMFKYVVVALKILMFGKTGLKMTMTKTQILINTLKVYPRTQ